MYYVYLIQSEKDKSLYIGFCNDINRRLIEHNKGKSNFTKNKIPYKLIYFEGYLDKTDARKREISLKKQRMQKEFILKNIRNSLLK